MQGVVWIGKVRGSFEINYRNGLFAGTHATSQREHVSLAR